jgi:hypothetical protein
MKARVTRLYKTGKWNIDKVRASVGIGWITEEDFKEITGEDY